MTNGDKIRNMTDEELATEIISSPTYETCINFCKEKEVCREMLYEKNEEIPDKWCKQCLLEWLQKEVE